METVGTWWMWAGFFAFVVAMLAVDLFLLGGRKAHRVSFKEAAGWSVVWVGVALAFNALLWWYLDGSQGREIANAKALEFLTGYLVEKSLAVDLTIRHAGQGRFLALLCAACSSPAETLTMKS